MLTPQVVLLGRDNEIRLRLDLNGTPASLTGVTRVQVVLKPATGNPTTVDSQTAATAFDWGTGGGVLILKLGGQSIPAGAYTAEVVTFDPTHALGISWGTFPVTVK